MTLADWIIGFAFGFGTAVLEVALYRAIRAEQADHMRDALTRPEYDGGFCDQLYRSEQGEQPDTTTRLP